MNPQEVRDSRETQGSLTLRRRTLIAAWSAPVVAIAVEAPAFAGSPAPVDLALTLTLSNDRYIYNGDPVWVTASIKNNSTVATTGPITARISRFANSSMTLHNGQPGWSWTTQESEFVAANNSLSIPAGGTAKWVSALTFTSSGTRVLTWSLDPGSGDITPTNNAVQQTVTVPRGGACYPCIIVL